MKAVLDGMRVIDCTFFQVGPVAGEMLGDLGADVIHVEQKGSGDPQRGFKEIFGIKIALMPIVHFELCNRNKRSIALDLKNPAGKEILHHLVKKSDVFLCNFRPAAIKKLGIDYQTLSKINPKLVYGSCNSFGKKGPDSQMPSFDIVIQARSGMMFNVGEPDAGPTYSSNATCDRIAGIMFAYGILAALLARERYGIGQEVETSQLASSMALQAMGIILSTLTGHKIPRLSRKKAGNPLFNWYLCKDGKWLTLALLLGNKYWPTLCKALDAVYLEKDPRFEDVDRRKENCEELIKILDGIFITKTYDEWESKFKATGDLIFSRCNDFSDLSGDPQVIENGYLVDVDHPVLGKIKTVAPPFKLSKTPATIRTAAPEYGQHTEELLLEAGYSWDDILRFKERGAI